MDNFFNQAAHGLNTQGQGNHIQQQHLVAALIADQIPPLAAQRPWRPRWSGSSFEWGWRLNSAFDFFADSQGARGAANQNDFIHLICAEAGIAQGLLRGAQGFIDQAIN